MILGGAFLLIYNVMSITLGNDIRQYGLLKTIGTTGGQIRKIVFCQTGRMILAGCLLGAAAGSFVVKFLLPGTLGELYLHGMGSAGGMAVFYPAFLAASVVFVGLTTLLAAGDRCQKSGEVQSHRVCPLRGDCICGSQPYLPPSEAHPAAAEQYPAETWKQETLQ